jgi:hypothetical protein
VGRFGDLLKDQLLYEAFMGFLATEYAQENLAFFREVMEFEVMNPSEKKDVKKRAHAICERYLGIGPAGEEQKLNLPLRLISSVRVPNHSNIYPIHNSRTFVQAMYLEFFDGHAPASVFFFFGRSITGFLWRRVDQQQSEQKMHCQPIYGCPNGY